MTGASFRLTIPAVRAFAATLCLLGGLMVAADTGLAHVGEASEIDRVGSTNEDVALHTLIPLSRRP